MWINASNPRRLCKWWVVLCLVLNVGGLAIQIVGRDEMQILIKRTMLAQLEKQNQPAPELTPQMLKGLWYAQAGCAGLLGIVPPLVIGVFLLGSKRRAEVATWTH